MGMFLDNAELQELTGRKRRDCQVKALRFMGIEHRKRPDGSIAILTRHVDSVMGCAEKGARVIKEVEPNWDMINA